VRLVHVTVLLAGDVGGVAVPLHLEVAHMPHSVYRHHVLPMKKNNSCALPHSIIHHHVSPKKRFAQNDPAHSVNSRHVLPVKSCAHMRRVLFPFTTCVMHKKKNFAHAVFRPHAMHGLKKLIAHVHMYCTISLRTCCPYDQCCGSSLR
jgi:hypothetical protein